MSEVIFKTTPAEDDLICLIVDRAFRNLIGIDQISLAMDLSACHSNGCPLDLSQLLGFAHIDFAHDVYGLINHMNRRTGKLMDGFVPRCVKRELVFEACDPPPEGCNAVLFHGPGHQSKTTCKVRGNHTVHETPYGRHGQVARWLGDEGCTDFFDDPVEIANA